MVNRSPCSNKLSDSNLNVISAFNGGLDSIPGPSSARTVRNPQHETARIYLRDFERREVQISVRALALLKDLNGEKQESLITRLLEMFEESRRG